MDLLSTSHLLRLSDVDEERDGPRYRRELSEHRVAFDRLVELLNEPANEQRLQDASRRSQSSLSGVVAELEADPVIRDVLLEPDSHRFHQAVGVVVRVKMDRLGWATTGRKGVVQGSEFFGKAERYQRRAAEADLSRHRALEGLAAVAEIGTEDEQRRTQQVLLDALAATRAAEGRPF